MEELGKLSIFIWVLLNNGGRDGVRYSRDKKVQVYSNHDLTREEAQREVNEFAVRNEQYKGQLHFTWEPNPHSLTPDYWTPAVEVAAKKMKLRSDWHEKQAAIKVGGTD